MELVHVSVEKRVAVVTIDRPESMNAFNTEVLTTLLAAVTFLGPRDDVGAVVITGAGSKAFVAGADIAEMKEKSAAEAHAFSELGQQLTTTIEGLPQPVIAAVNGYALGGGCEVALACDIRLCSETARFGQPEISLGIIPGWGGTQRLSRLCGPGFARELIYTGRVVDAQEALKWGLVNAVYPPDQLMPEATRLAETIADKSRVALRYAKLCCDRAFDQDLAGGLRLEADLFALTYASEDQREGMEAFLAKRQPQFKHR